MKPSVLLTFAVLAALFIIDGASAAICTSVQSGDWDDPNTWDCAAVPNDTAIIACPHIVTVTSAGGAVATVIVENCGTLIFDNGAGAATLTISNGLGLCNSGLNIEPHGRVGVTACGGGGGSTLILSNAGAKHVIDGVLALPNNGSVLQITGGHTVICGTGRIVGGDDSAAIKIATGLTVQMETTIQGHLRIEDISGANGVFINNGLVDANANGTITCDDLKFRGSGQWRISHPNGEIEFEPGVDATKLATDFHIRTGTLDVQDNVITSGHLHWLDGAIVVASGKEFRAN